MTQRYFVTPATPVSPTRFHLLHGHTVVRTQASRPDGTEVPQPIYVKWQTDAAAAMPAPDRRTFTTFAIAGRNVGTPASIQQKRQRGGAARKRIAKTGAAP